MNQTELWRVHAYSIGEDDMTIDDLTEFINKQTHSMKGLELWLSLKVTSTGMITLEFDKNETTTPERLIEAISSQFVEWAKLALKYGGEGAVFDKVELSEWRYDG